MSSSRRDFLRSGIAVTTAAATRSAGQPPPSIPGSSKLLNVDLRALVSRGDLIYTQPAQRSEEGIPIGNGTIGTLIWTTLAQLRMQINRVDVYASNCESNSFFERNSDYCGGCAFVDLDIGDGAKPAFPAAGFRQHLSIYDGVLQTKGPRSSVRIFAHPIHDVIAIELGGAMTARLRMLRYGSNYYGPRVEEFTREHASVIETRSHTALSQLLVRDERIILLQEFREGGFCCKSAVVIAAPGTHTSATFANEEELQLRAGHGTEKTFVLIGSAATFDAEQDVIAKAMEQVDRAAAKTFRVLQSETMSAWHAFWSRGFVQVSGGEDAALVEKNYAYFLYLMNATSRGKFPPKFNGMLWNTGGDRRTWGAQHWFANLSCYYEALFATNRLDLLDPMFDMYSGMYERCCIAARQQWGSGGMYIPETIFFDGLEKLPDDVAAEMRDLYLLRKRWEERSIPFREYALTKLPHSSRWNWIQSGKWIDGRWTITERGSGPYGNVTHILGTTAKVAYLYWRRYEYTLDTEWLRTRAYPMLKAAAEFYRNFPTVQKGSDGKYHIHGSNSNESVWGARDTDEDIAAMHGILPVAVRAARILDVDSDLQERWLTFLAHLPSLPTSDDPEALKPADYSGPRVFVRGLRPAVKTGGLLPDPNSLPMWFFDLCHAGSADIKTLEVASATFASYFPHGMNEKTPVAVLSKLAIAAALLGKSDAVRFLIPNQIRVLTQERESAYKNGSVLANRMTLREGPQALDAQRLGRAAEALHSALLQSLPPAPGATPVIHVFPAWPREWNASYTLLARGGFLVTSSIDSGRVSFVELLSRSGAECTLRNPWSGAVTLFRDNKLSETVTGPVLKFPTRVGEQIVIVPEGTKPETQNVA